MALWIVMVQSLGGEHFSADETSRFLGPLLHWLFPEAGPELLGQFQLVVRKTAHVVEYGILAVLSIRAWRISHHGSRWTAAVASMAIVVGVAAVDEWRQAQTADREGATFDVLLDTFGGVSGLAARRLAARRLAARQSAAGRLAERWLPW